MPKKEKDFQTEFKHAFDHFLSVTKKTGMYEKIPDTGFQKNKFDCWVMFPDKNFIGLELKMCKQKTVFNFRSMFGYGKQEHELVNLSKVKACGFPAYVLVNHFLGRGQNRALAFEIDDAWTYYNQGSVKESEAIFLELPTTHTGIKKVFDLIPLFHGL